MSAPETFYCGDSDYTLVVAPDHTGFSVAGEDRGFTAAWQDRRIDGPVRDKD